MKKLSKILSLGAIAATGMLIGILAIEGALARAGVKLPTKAAGKGYEWVLVKTNHKHGIEGRTEAPATAGDRIPFIGTVEEKIELVKDASVSAGVKELLLFDPDWRVRLALAEQSEERAVQILIKDPNPLVRERAVKKALFLDQSQKEVAHEDPCPLVRAALVNRDDISFQDAFRRENDPSVTVQLAVMAAMERLSKKADKGNHFSPGKNRFK